MTPPSGLPATWPLRDHSRMVTCGALRWHVQDLPPPDHPRGTLLLLHGAGGATHSWRALAPLLGATHHVVMVDLPGHGFTRSSRRDRSGLDAMAEDLAALCAQERWPVGAVIGHSAGAALSLRLAEILPLRAVVGINAALGSFTGIAGLLFPMLARALTVTPFVPTLFARLSGTDARVAALLASTGSTVDAQGLACYRRLVGDAAHVEGTLAMMAQWSLDGLMQRLPQIAAPVLLIAASGDRTVPATVSERAATRLPAGTCHAIEGLGHLVHEEAAPVVADLILPFLDRHLRP